VQDSNGNFYGTTSYGGVHLDCDGYGCGTVFRITAGGMFKSLYSFDNIDGALPISALMEATNGIFYGTTADGGASGCGTIFSLTAGSTLNTLRSFDCTDGAGPDAALVQANNGDFWGTTAAGGAHDGGTAFRIIPSGSLRRRYNFCHYYDCKHGTSPDGLVQGTDGNFYGVTGYGGPSGAGTIFRITPDDKLTTLFTFGDQDGAYPNGPLVQGTDGKFYGTTSNVYGAVFSLSVGLGPFVKSQPTFGAAGAAVTILGTSLTGATSVTFNGTPATFTVKSKSEITTTVPTGATTGTVQVVTPGGTLSSNLPFRVTP
jgi:uncharacterized repeat protein (TIGR03803 family)